MRLFTFSALELFGLFIATITILVVGAYETLANSFLFIPTLRDNVQSSVGDRFDYFLELIEAAPISANIVISLAWAVFGSVIFIALWAGLIVLIDFRNEIKISATFVHPKSFHQSSFWGAYVLRSLYKAALIILLVGGSVLYFTVFLPTVFAAVQLIISDTQLIAIVIGIVSLALVVALAAHGLIILLRLLFGRRRLFDKTLI